jgi:hypothetical protein
MRFLHTLVLLTLISCLSSCGGVQDTNFRTLAWDDFVDKVDGGWLGQMIGVEWPAATEFKWQGEIIPFDVDNYMRLIPEYGDRWRSELRGLPRDEKMAIVNNRDNWEYFTPDGAADQDDTYIELMFLDAIKTYGVGVTQRQVAEHWLKYMNYQRVWHANKEAHTNFKNGIWPPQSGMKEYNKHWEDIDFQIEADLFGIICPGLPQESNKWGEKYGTLMNSGEGLYGGLFVAGMYAIAYFEQDPETIVRYGLRCIPADSKYAAKINLVLDHYTGGKTWQQAWQALEDKWKGTYTCPNSQRENSVHSIDAGINGAYIVMGLLYGEGDFQQTINISTRCGQDSDCNPSNAAGILGTAYGASWIPEKFRAPMKDFVHNQSMAEIYPAIIPRRQIVDDTINIAVQIIEGAGGEVTTDAQGNKIVRIPRQEPVAYSK